MQMAKRAGNGLHTMLLGASCLLLAALAPVGAVADRGGFPSVVTTRSPLQPQKPPLGPADYGDSEQQRRRLARQVVLQERWAEVHALLAGQHVSRKSHEILRGRGLGPARLDEGLKAASNTAAGTVDTLQVLIVRIAFQTDRSGSLTSVTEDGNFTLRPALPDEIIDRPPHNRSFYEAHLTGLAEYYRLMSGGRLFIRGRVLPTGLEDSYFLSDLADYGPGQAEFWTLESLERLVRDMIAVTDSTTQADGPVDLSDFDDDNPFTYVIFVHAGSDWQSDINLDSPNDVPTFFVSLGEAAPLRGGGHISECSVIPETTSQDGLLGSIAGALHHEFGHALGLVDIYNTTTGLTQVGIWSLMDSGTNLFASVGIDTTVPPDDIADEILDVVGLLPPSLSAWDKWFLGWLKTEPVAGDVAEYRLPAVQVPHEDYPRYRSAGIDFRLTYPQAVVGGSSPGEFFLVENRWVPLDASEMPDQQIFFVSDPETGVILYMGGDLDFQTDQYRNTGMYDFFLPESGLLVWHVNMNRIEPNLETNTINAWGDGLRLVEADGIQDIGILDAYVLGWIGSYRDPFNEVNNDALYIEGAPSSRAFDRSWTGFQMSEITAVAQGGRATMSFRASVEPLSTGSPLMVAAIDSAEAAVAGGSPGPRALVPATATAIDLIAQDSGASLPTLLVADGPGPHWQGETYRAKLFGWQPDGTPAFAQSPDLPAGAGWEFAAPLSGPPVWARLAASQLPVEDDGLLVGLVNGELFCFDDILDATGTLTLLWGPVAVGDTLAFAPTPNPSGGRILCCVPPDSLVLLDGQGQAVGTALVLTDPGGGAFGGFTGAPVPLTLADGSEGWAVIGTHGWYLVESDPAGLLPSPEFLSFQALPVVGDVWHGVIRSATRTLVSLFDREGLLGAWSAPSGRDFEIIDWDSRSELAPVTEPAVADLDGNGQDDLILLTATDVQAYQASGVPLTGFPVALAELFPLPDSTRIAGPVVICDATGDGTNEIHFMTDQGHLVGLDARGTLLPRTPFRIGDRDRYSLTVGAASESAERILWLMSEGGRRGPPLERRLTNGQVVGYRLPAAGQATQRTSEWLGTAGGARRAGPEGTATPLAAPAAWHQDLDSLVLYPNPLHGDDLTVRFYSHGDHDARLVIFNLEGEIVINQVISVAPGQINEHHVVLSGLASGMYVCQLERQTTSGLQRDATSLAVER